MQMFNGNLCAATICSFLTFLQACSFGETYPIVDTGQVRCFDNEKEISYPAVGSSFFGQDAQYRGNSPKYRDNGDGTISDLVTGLMWQKDPGSKKTFREAVAGAAACRVGGYDDWRLPGIKELYSLIQFRGEDFDLRVEDPTVYQPFLDTEYFTFYYGDPEQGERLIDSQIATSTRYVGKTMGGNETMFGVNFADGRIKGYPIGSARPGLPEKKYYVYYVRGNPQYGINDFHDNGDGTVTDRATELMWAKCDSGHLKAGKDRDGKLNWEEALRWAEELEFAGYDDWRLPNAKELQSIVDYSRSPDTTRSAAIHPIFEVTPIRDPQGQLNFPNYWSSTTHQRMGAGNAACYIAFGRCQGWMRTRRGQVELLDVHGAGAQRSDPKAGDASRFPRGRGPQGDVITIDNLVRPVRGGKTEIREQGPPPRSPASNAMPSASRGTEPSFSGAPRRPFSSGMSGARPRAGFVERLDRNGDGQVSRNEFDGPPSAFHHLDADNSGFLSGEEAPHRARRSAPLEGRRRRRR